MVEILELNDYDFDEFISKAKRKQVIIVIPSFFGLTIASEVLRALAPGKYDYRVMDDYQNMIKKNFESGQFIGVSCCVFPHYHNYAEMESQVEWYDSEEDGIELFNMARIKSFQDIFDIEVDSLQTRNMIFILDDVRLHTMRAGYIDHIKQVAQKAKYRGEIDSLIITTKTYN